MLFEDEVAENEEEVVVEELLVVLMVEVAVW